MKNVNDSYQMKLDKRSKTVVSYDSWITHLLVWANLSEKDDYWHYYVVMDNCQTN